MNADWLRAERIGRDYFWLYMGVVYSFYLVVGFIGGLGVLTSATVHSVLLWYDVLTFVPNLYVAFRRLHDVNKSGWYVFVPVYGWVLLYFLKGDRHANRYGPVPKHLKAPIRRFGDALLIIDFLFAILGLSLSVVSMLS